MDDMASRAAINLSQYGRPSDRHACDVYTPQDLTSLLMSGWIVALTPAATGQRIGREGR